jgi:hypothetical protein
MQCCGSGMFILDPGSENFPSRIRIFFIPDPGSSSKNLSNQKNGFSALGNVIRVVYTGSGSLIRVLTFYPYRIPFQGSKRHRLPDPDPQN